MRTILKWGFARIGWMDAILAPFVYVCAVFLGFVRWAGVERLKLSKRALLAAKTFPIRLDYYEPDFGFLGLRRPLHLPRDLPGLDLNVEGQIELLARLDYGRELAGIPMHKSGGENAFYLKNGFFEGGEADIWYGMIRRFKPKRIFEIGSGFSTLIAIRAIEANRREDAGYRCRHVCIEPYEKPWLGDLGVELIRDRVETLDPGFFDSLGEDDFLFIDSSHIIRTQGDVLFEIQQILPRLRKGVMVHIHDIYTPMDYPQAWLVDQVRFWNEQYLLEVFLCGNRERWSVQLACFFLFKTRYAELKARCPLLTPDSEPNSFYIRKTH